MLSMRTRKLIGTFVMVSYIMLYSLLAMTLAMILLPGSSAALQALYYAIAGLVWVLPCIPLISWMQKPD